MLSDAGVGGRIGSMVTQVAHELDLVDVIEILGFPLVLYIAHRLDDTARNHMDPNRTLLRPRAVRRSVRG